MFYLAVRSVLEREEKIRKVLKNGDFVIGEYLQSPKHNTLAYTRVPNGNIIVFDAFIDGKWIDDSKKLKEIADQLDYETVPILYEGENVTKEQVKELLQTESILGIAQIEGVVIKNYSETMFLGNQIFPLFTKYVSEKFKEKHQENPEFRSHKNKVDDFLLSYRTEARWNKAIQTLRDSGQLEMQPRDIPKIMQQVKNDILEEETANIKEELFELFMKDILTVAVRGLPEHFKEWLADSVKTQ